MSRISLKSHRISNSRNITSILMNIVTRNLPMIATITDRDSPGFRPGIISRYEPGVHEVDLEDFLLVPSVDEDSGLNVRKASQDGASVNKWDGDSATKSDGASTNKSNGDPATQPNGHTVYGQTSLCAAHLYGTSLRVHSPLYDLSPRPDLRRIDATHRPIAEFLRTLPPVAAPAFNTPRDQVVILQLTRDGRDCISAPGLGIYGAPGNGKSFVQERFGYRCADTDFLYDPDTRVVRHLAALGMTVFSNQYDLLIGAVPLVMFLPSEELLLDRICNQVNVSRSEVVRWVTDLNRRVAEVRDSADDIRRRGECVILVHARSSDAWIMDFMAPLSWSQTCVPM
ncbi:uncharacterized protein LOC108254642 isoform X1 [Diaphorina citri]|uniref:Uncharacterized protein LOC108254642 isoform X1 n=1 Tax=Diaphorina citri TaxID=121845 RepID=A0A1S4ET46_DIACI|nr:uncharacterized protein LOC108254642 isoform X1 [Diaphorina citri]